MKVLIVEDSDIVRQAIRGLLADIPNVEIVGEAGDAEEAERAVGMLNPDVVTLDIRMPKGSGVDVLRRIKRHDPSPMVIVLTNYPYPQHRKACKEAGAEYFFDKSVEFEKVAEVLRGMGRAT